MMDFIHRVIDVDTQTLAIIVSLSCLAAFLKREILGSLLIAVVIAPFYVLASLLCLYVFRFNYLSMVSDADREATIAAAVGITLVFVMFLIILDGYRAISARRVNKNMEKRNLIQGQKSKA